MWKTSGEKTSLICIYWVLISQPAMQLSCQSHDHIVEAGWLFYPHPINISDVFFYGSISHCLWYLVYSSGMLKGRKAANAPLGGSCSDDTYIFPLHILCHSIYIHSHTCIGFQPFCLAVTSQTWLKGEKLCLCFVFGRAEGPFPDSFLQICESLTGKQQHQSDNSRQWQGEHWGGVHGREEYCSWKSSLQHLCESCTLWCFILGHSDTGKMHHCNIILGSVDLVHARHVFLKINIYDFRKCLLYTTTLYIWNYNSVRTTYIFVTCFN